MKTEITNIIQFNAGYKIEIRYFNGLLYSAGTSDNSLIDQYNKEAKTYRNRAIKKRAERGLIRFVKDQNNLP